MQSEENWFVYEETLWTCGEFIIVKADLPFLSDDFETGTYLSIVHEGKKKNIPL